jgi:hypothetical protein
MTTKTILFLLLVPAALVAQNPDKEALRERERKIETILRVQDLRTRHDGTLLALLSDRDPAVRERATLAFGSIQDTAVLAPLVVNLTEGSAAVQEAAAWAIGQTAPALHLAARQSLEHDLLWARFDQTKAQDRLIEEVGKFGTSQGLADLVLKFGASNEHRTAVMMGIARFAIRNITSSGSSSPRTPPRGRRCTPCNASATTRNRAPRSIGSSRSSCTTTRWSG